MPNGLAVRDSNARVTAAATDDEAEFRRGLDRNRQRMASGHSHLAGQVGRKDIPDRETRRAFEEITTRKAIPSDSPIPDDGRQRQGYRQYRDVWIPDSNHTPSAAR